MPEHLSIDVGDDGLTRMVRMAGKLTLPLASPLFPTITGAAS